MQTSRRDIFLLACCQALLLVNSAGLVSINGLIGYSIAPSRTLATFGATTYVLGSALAALPMSLWMARVGRRAGFMTGALVNIAGCLVAVLALQAASFVLFCLATAVIGVYNAVGLQYRFAAAEVAAPADRATAISLVLAGGVVGGFAGPETAKLTQHMFTTPFLGSFVALAAVAMVALALQSQVRVPTPVRTASAGGGRPLAAIMRQPAFIVAVAAAALMATAAGIALNGITVAHFVVALALVGAGWNFLYTGGTTLLTETYTPEERARTQGVNDLVVFATMGVSSFASGALVTSSGWDSMNRAALPVLAAIAAMALWLMWMRVQSSRRAVPPPAR